MIKKIFSPSLFKVKKIVDDERPLLVNTTLYYSLETASISSFLIRTRGVKAYTKIIVQGRFKISSDLFHDHSLKVYKE